MRNHFILTPIILLTTLLCCQCTTEKRLYNRGFHVEFRKRALPVRDEFFADTEEKRIILEKEENPLTNLHDLEETIPEIEQEVDGAVGVESVIKQNSFSYSEQPELVLPRDSIPKKSVDKPGYTKERKKLTVMTLGFLVAFFFLIVVLCVISLTSETTGAFIFGLFGVLSFFIGFALLLALICALAVPATEEPSESEKQTETEKEPEVVEEKVVNKRKERIAVGVIFGIIFLFAIYIITTS